MDLQKTAASPGSLYSLPSVSQAAVVSHIAHPRVHSLGRRGGILHLLKKGVSFDLRISYGAGMGPGRQAGRQAESIRRIQWPPECGPGRAQVCKQEGPPLSLGSACTYFFPPNWNHQQLGRNGSRRRLRMPNCPCRK